MSKSWLSRVTARYLAYTANQAGASRLTVLDLRSKQELAVPSLPPGLISDLHFDTQSRQLAFAYASPANRVMPTCSICRPTKSNPGLAVKRGPWT